MARKKTSCMIHAHFYTSYCEDVSEKQVHATSQKGQSSMFVVYRRLSIKYVGWMELETSVKEELSVNSRCLDKLVERRCIQSLEFTDSTKNCQAKLHSIIMALCLPINFHPILSISLKEL